LVKKVVKLGFIILGGISLLVGYLEYQKMITVKWMVVENQTSTMMTHAVNKIAAVAQHMNHEVPVAGLGTFRICSWSGSWVNAWLECRKRISLRMSYQGYTIWYDDTYIPGFPDYHEPGTAIYRGTSNIGMPKQNRIRKGFVARSFNIPKDLDEKLRLKAVKDNVRFSEITICALKEYLK